MIFPNIKRIKPLNLILAGVVSLLILMFGVLPISETITHRSLANNLFLEQTEPLPSEEVEIASDKTWNEKNQKLLQTGEYFQFFPGVKFDFKTRELLSGGLYFSGELLTIQAREIARLSPYKDPKDLSRPSPLEIGQISASGIIIASPEAGSYVSYSDENKFLNVFAFEHPVYINFKNSSKPFVLPAYHRVQIRLSSADKIENVYYSKKIKELSLEKFYLKGEEDSFEEYLKTQELKLHPEITVDKILNAKNKKLKELIEYADNYIKYWEGIGNPSALHKIQQKLPFYPKNKESDYQFFQKIEPYIKARKATNDNEARTNLLIFENNQKESSWEESFSSQEDIMAFYNFQTIERYNVLYNWFKVNLPNEDEKAQNIALFDYWNNLDDRTYFDNIYRNLVKSEILINSSILTNQKEARLAIGEIESQIRKIDVIGEGDRLLALTDLRRYFSSILYNNPEILSNSQTFESWSYLTQKEIIAYEKLHTLENQNKNDFPEILAEIIRELYATIDHLLEKNEESFNLEPFVFNEMTQFIKDQKVKELEKEYFDRPLFSAQEELEFELLSSFDEIQNSEDLERLAQKIAFAEQNSNNIIDQEEISEEIMNEDSSSIGSKEELLALLENTGRNIETKDAILEEENGIIRFRNLFLDKEELAGVFSIEKQSFDSFEIGDLQANNLTLIEWGLYVIDYEKTEELDLDFVLDEKDEMALKINQGSSLAKNERIKIQEMFNTSHVELDLANIFALSPDYQTFLIKVKHPKGLVRFIYKADKDIASEFLFTKNNEKILITSGIPLNYVSNKINDILN